MGYFPFDRNVREHWVYKDSQYYHVWSEMLFTARYAEEPKTFLHEGELITVEYGEFIFGRISWSEKLGISEQRLRTLISKMKKEEMIVPTKQYRKSTVYLVKNYRLYNQQSNQQESLIHQAFEGHANQQTNVTSTSNQPASNQQVTTKEESNKEIKKEEDIKDSGTKVPERKKFNPPTLEQVTEYCFERGCRVDPENWYDHYTANGWKVGKNQMKDWKAAVRTWEKNKVNSATTSKPYQSKAERDEEQLNRIKRKAEGSEHIAIQNDGARSGEVIDLDKSEFSLF